MLDRLDLPVTLVVGELDPVIVPTRHRLVVVPGAGHDVHVTHPAAVAEAIATVIAENTRV